MMKKGSSPSVLHSIPYILGWVWMSVMGPMLLVKLFSKVAHSIFTRYCYSKDKLAGKVVLVTGASSGVGAALCKVLYERGCRIIMAARSLDKLNKLKQELVSSCSTRIVQEPIVLQLDITELDSISKKIPTLLKQIKNIDILINNAGQSYRGEAVDTLTNVDLSLMLVNYFGHVAVTKAVLPHMIERKSGHIVSISSIQGRLAIPHRSAYTASKHALQGFMDSLRAEVAKHNVSVSVVSPGYIATQLSINAVTADGSSYGKMDETTSTGMTPAYVARRIEGMLQNEEEELLLVPWHYKIALFLRLCTPELLSLIMKTRAKKAIEQPQSDSKLKKL